MNAPANRGVLERQPLDRSTSGRELAAMVAAELRDPNHPHIVAARRVNAAIAASAALARWRRRAVQ